MKGPRPEAPPAVRWIVRTLEDAGHETWAVGGAVRDRLLGIPSGDWDLTTHARPQQIRKIFRRTVPLGMEHGTVGVLARDGTMYEVTTFRRDVATDGRHAVVAFAERIEEDLGRRDFTLNAIAWHPLREELLDPYGGLADIEARVLRTVGAPADRFREDYLRILRALRFAGRFELTVDGPTWDALCSLVDHLSALSAERIRDELLKILGQDDDPTTALELYAASGALRVLYPELDALRGSPLMERSPGQPSARRPDRASGADPSHDPSPPEGGSPGRALDRWTLSLATVRALPKIRPLLRLAALLRELEPDAAAAMLLRLRLSNAQIDETARLAGAAPLPPPDASESVFRRWLSTSGPQRLSALARLDLARAKAEAAGGGPSRVQDVVAAWQKARKVRTAEPPLSVGDLALDGRDLISLGLRPGPGFGRILDALLEWVLDDPRRNERALLERRALELAGARESADPATPGRNAGGRGG